MRRRERLADLAGRLTDVELDTALGAALAGRFDVAEARLARVAGRGELLVPWPSCRRCGRRHEPLIFRACRPA